MRSEDSAVEPERYFQVRPSRARTPSLLERTPPGVSESAADTPTRSGRWRLDPDIATPGVDDGVCRMNSARARPLVPRPVGRRDGRSPFK